MTLSDSWVRARNVIMQQTEILLQEMNRLEDENRAVKCANSDFSIENDRLRDKPSVGSEGHYQKRLAEYQNTIITLTEELKKWKEFGKLKDRAKMKVEGDRDYYKMRMNDIAALLEDVERRARRYEEYKTLDARRAQEYADLQRQNADNVRQNALLKKKVDALQEIVETGIKGLRDEDARRQRQGYSW